MNSREHFFRRYVGRDHHVVRLGHSCITTTGTATRSGLMAVHVIGAGLAGLAAAMRLAERDAAVFVHEAASQAGGRCRSYHDPVLDMVIDNGNHLLLSGNDAALAFVSASGAGR